VEEAGEAVAATARKPEHAQAGPVQVRNSLHLLTFIKFSLIWTIFGKLQEVVMYNFWAYMVAWYMMV
jgi:hypothetical protein